MHILKASTAIAFLALVLAVPGANLETPLPAQDPQPQPPAPERLELLVNSPDRVDEYQLVVIFVETNADHCRVRVRQNLFDSVPTYELREQGFYGFTAPPGEYLIEVDVFDAEMGIDGHLSKVVIGEVKPPPKPDDDDDPPTPNPDIPDDAFGNIGRDAAEWAKKLGLDRTAEAAANYREVGQRLLGEKTPILPTIDSSAGEIAKLNAADSLIPPETWVEWGLKVNERWQSTVTNRTQAGNFYKAVAAGLEGVK